MHQRSLEAFLVLARELNFSRAAHMLHITQSTLSASIKKLEAELRTPLFARSTRSVSLTDAGAAFLPAARAAVEALEAARAVVDPSGELRGHLTVGMLNGLTLVDVPALTGDFHRRHPRVRLRLETSQRGAAGLVEDVKRSRVDVAFVSTDAADPQLRVVPIRKYHLRLAVAPDHPLAARRAVTLAEIADEPFVDMPLGFGHRTVVDRAFAQHSRIRDVLVETTDLTTIPDYVAHGLGVALLPLELATSGSRPLATLTISDADISWTLAIVMSATRPPSHLVTAFLDLVQRHIRPERPF
ncbi:LysR family transcriptional regulator [Saccharothrix coeruleofusca]|uniref:LysR family transcriptional regulator n=1 Tax=Saccharothrix coeruleofusca TaxID=33919 RepID=UPI00166FB48C|nr:LysR family transcriptional regulator [Saccharothrix coeruleofusca]MBP2336148.1 DNA-binding transcriptional LysR family regulator [Saccharothrix coeruleofusca]